MIRVSVCRESGAPLALEVLATQTVAETKAMLREQDPTFAFDELAFEGVPVPDERTIGSFPDIGELIFTAAKRQVEVRKRPRCAKTSCNSVPLRGGGGGCPQCNGHFCARHRLMEQHDCAGLQNCKQSLHQRNAMRLQQQQTVPHKV